MDIAIKKSAVNNSKQNAVNLYFPSGRLAGIWTARAWDRVDISPEGVVTVMGKVSRAVTGGSAKLVGGSRP